MTVAALIAEYNPFHNGHLYHIEETKRLTGADFLVVVMSGNFVQRGEPAVIDKFSRAEMALAGGADLVLELPVFYACGSAEYFARGAVALLDGLGCVDYLCFGSESGSLQTLARAADLFLQEPSAYQDVLRRSLKEGAAYPAAREQAMAALVGSDAARSVLEGPNNILGIEYLKALKRSGSAIRPLAIRRIGGYHDIKTDGAFCSASALRALLAGQARSASSGASLSGFADDAQMPALPCVPKRVSKILTDAWGRTFPVFPAHFSSMLQYRLLTAASCEELASCFDIPDALARRIYNLRHQFTDPEAFASLVKTRNFTEAAVRRALLHILLQLPAAPLPVSYARVLGLRRQSRELLHLLKKEGHLPLLSKLADAHSVFFSFYPNPTKAEDAMQLLALDIQSSDLYYAAAAQAFHRPSACELTRQIVLLP